MKVPFDKQSFYNSIVEYLFVVILVLNCNTIWTSYDDTSLNRILKLAIVVVTALYIVTGNRVSKYDIHKILIFGIFAIVYFVIYAVAVNYVLNGYLYFLIDAFCIYIFVITAKDNDRAFGILYKYEDIILLIAVISIFFWIFGSILGVIEPTGIEYSNWSGNDVIKEVPSYYNVYFETQTITNTLIRNTGIFTEAPMYNFNLCIALLIELFGRENVSKIRCAILIVTILTTFSTTGWSMMVIALIAKFIFMGSKTQIMQAIKILAVPTLIVAGVLVVWILITGRLDTSSGSTRVDDFAAGFKAWLTHPIFGAGLNNTEYVKQFMSSFRADNLGFSNSPMQILYQGGIFLALPYLYFAYKWVRVCLEQNSQWFVFFGCFAFLFIITVVSYRFLTLFLFMSYEFIECPETQKTKSEKSDKKDYLKHYLEIDKDDLQVMTLS